MKRQLYFPGRHGEQLNWLRNFRLKLAHHAAILGLTAEEVAKAEEDLDWLLYFLGALLEPSRRHALACTAAVKQLMSGKPGSLVNVPVFAPPSPPVGLPPAQSGALSRIFKLVQRIKCKLTYTDAIGLDLGIVTNLHHRESALPTFKLTAVRGENGEFVKGTFRRYGNYGVQVEMRRSDGNGDGEWEPLAAGPFTGSTFFDRRPLLDPTRPEIRQYRLRFWDGSGPSSDWTAVASITVSS